MRGAPQEKLIHQLFEEQVDRTPAAVAVAYEEQSLTYGELNERANRLAGYLRERGVGPDVLVGICLERSLDMVAGLLGILKAGGAYVPLDPAYPGERLSFMLADAAPDIVLTHERCRSRLPSGSAAVISLDSHWSEIERYPADDLSPEALGLQSRHLAYVIYTSGSTGQPKGAMNEHRAVVNRIVWMQSQYGLDGGARVLQKTPFSFDVSVWEFFWTLMSGARLIIARPEGHRDPAYLRDLIEASGVTTVHFVPSMLQAFLARHRQGRCPSVRHVVCSGEELPASLQNECLRLLPQARLSNLYGPTECAVDVTAWECSSDPQCRRVPIGRPIANTRIYILDADRKPVAVGTEGEIHIAGAAVGRGYWKRPELTAERFQPDPFAGDPRARMYRTGDFGRWREDGAIEYLGRYDQQVKIRGFRIELGEIEAQLARCAKVREVAVLAREDVEGEKRLVAYVVPHDPTAAPAAQELREQLRSALPEHMVPSAFVMLERMPVSPNGKLDRRALPPPDPAAHARPPYQQPVGAAERALAQIWQSLLRVARIGRDENFFDLGGHSLLAVVLCERIRSELGTELPLSAILEAPTIERLARRITGDAPADSLVLIRAGEGEPPVFLIHDAYGETLLYRTLALRLDSRHPVYGMHPRVLRGVPIAHTRVADMAGWYIAKLRSVQPRGPYFLGGLCAGGVIAFEMALQLQAQGEQVALVALIDAADTRAELEPYLDIRKRLDRIAGELRGHQTHSGIRRAGRIAGRLAGKLWGFTSYHLGKTWRGMRDRARLRLLRMWLDRGRLPPRLVGRLTVFATYLLAAAEYGPDRQFDGELVLFRATRGSGVDVDTPFIEFFSDHAFGWGPRASRGVRVIDVPGGHNSMLQEPHVSVLAQRLQEAIDRGCTKRGVAVPEAERAMG
ncbi:MAG TPA: amino acid adenylation domain-containing protein [Steroidobacteraceae bacterium]|nr:amino acid adenylation domain-containing protein [Steroidobacteraceae bacterium]